MSVVMPNVVVLDVANKPFMLSVIMLNVVMLRVTLLSVANKPFVLCVIMLNVVMLSIVAPIYFLTVVIYCYNSKFRMIVSIPGTGDAYNFEWHFKKRFHHKKIL
jgi:polyferredoxin